jgi:hypothetical protein
LARSSAQEITNGDSKKICNQIHSIMTIPEEGYTLFSIATGLLV